MFKLKIDRKTVDYELPKDLSEDDYTIILFGIVQTLYDLELRPAKDFETKKLAFLDALNSTFDDLRNL